MCGSRTDTSLGGYEFRFLSDANRAAFAANATKFAPQVGGYCAWGISGYDQHAPSGGGLWYACTETADCFEVAKYDSKLYFFLAAGPKAQMDATGADAYSGAATNFARYVSADQPYCFNTDRVM